jgi:hypothetical protein
MQGKLHAADALHTECGIVGAATSCGQAGRQSHTDEHCDGAKAVEQQGREQQSVHVAFLKVMSVNTLDLTITFAAELQPPRTILFGRNFAGFVHEGPKPCA